MFKLIKLAIYAMIGYALYEMYQGMQLGGSRWFGGVGGRSFGKQGGGFGAFTGGGEGMTDTASDTGGAETPHRVGRGVVSGSSTL